MFNLTRKGSWVCEAEMHLMSGQEVAPGDPSRTFGLKMGPVLNQGSSRILHVTSAHRRPALVAENSVTYNINDRSTSWSTRTCKTCHLLEIVRGETHEIPMNSISYEFTRNHHELETKGEDMMLVEGGVPAPFVSGSTWAPTISQVCIILSYFSLKMTHL